MHSCPGCGLEHETAVAEETPAPAVIVEPGPNENDVKIAEIEAAASIEREKIWTEQRGADLEQTVAELRGEVSGMREVLDRLQPSEPEPEPVPVIIDPPAPAEPGPAVPVPPPAPAEPKGKKQAGWWEGYG